ncbi:MAG: alpha-L-fucosidase, partial [Kiritimatiellia bacterium]
TNSTYHTSGAIVRYLVRAVARNGNLLLDVGPDARGVIDPQAVQVLRGVGAWLKVNGEAIYETRPIAPYESGEVFFTRKADGTVYAIRLSTNDGEAMPAEVILPAALVSGKRIVTLVGGDGTPLVSKPGRGNTIVVALPGSLRDHPPCADAWALKISPPALRP